MPVLVQIVDDEGAGLDGCGVHRGRGEADAPRGSRASRSRAALAAPAIGFLHAGLPGAAARARSATAVHVGLVAIATPVRTGIAERADPAGAEHARTIPID